MNDDLFDWDTANIAHIAEHEVAPEEAEQVILGGPLEMDFDKSILGKDRWSYIGETSEGRVLQVVITSEANEFVLLQRSDQQPAMKFRMSNTRWSDNERFQTSQVRK